MGYLISARGKLKISFQYAAKGGESRPVHSSALTAMAVTVVVNVAMNFKSNSVALASTCDHCYSSLGHRLFGGVAELLG